MPKLMIATTSTMSKLAISTCMKAETNDGDSHIEVGDSRIVQFSHFSVKELLTSSRLATAGGEVSNYHIDLGPAHVILAQVCLGVLLQIKDNVDGHTPKGHPLARYAAEHWATHAQSVELSHLQNGMEYLFDPGKPHFKVWLTLYDIDTEPRRRCSLSILRTVLQIPRGSPILRSIVDSTIE
jgi:hypothetical protein